MQKELVDQTLRRPARLPGASRMRRSSFAPPERKYLPWIGGSTYSLDIYWHVWFSKGEYVETAPQQSSSGNAFESCGRIRYLPPGPVASR